MAVEVTVSGNKKIETLMKQFNEKFPYLQLGIFPMSAKDDKTKTPVDKSLTIAKVRTKVAPGEISINGRKLVKNLEREFDDIFGIYVEVCYCGKDGIDYYTAGAYDDLSLTALNNEIESLGGVKDKWCADELHATGDVAPTPKTAPVEEITAQAELAKAEAAKAAIEAAKAEAERIKAEATAKAELDKAKAEAEAAKAAAEAAKAEAERIKAEATAAAQAALAKTKAEASKAQKEEEPKAKKSISEASAMIEKLFGVALVDGEITEKEQQVLSTKAVEAGADADEFKILLDYRIYLSKNKTAKNPFEGVAIDYISPDLKTLLAAASIDGSLTDARREVVLKNTDADKGVVNILIDAYLAACGETDAMLEASLKNPKKIKVDDLIALACANGRVRVSDEEKKTIIGVAKKAGEDPDVFEMMLDAKIYEIKSKDPFAGTMVKVEAGEYTQKWEYSWNRYYYPNGDHRKKQESEICYSWESRKVKLSAFQICKYQVTQAQWKMVMGGFPENQSFPGDDNPVTNVSWNDVQQFLEKLNQLTGKNYRLLTEAQWDFAARGGSKTHGYTYAGGNDLAEVAWYDGNSGSATHPVGLKKANELGLYDMTGNVCEWCLDWYEERHSTSEVTDPCCSMERSCRVRRGGSWDGVAGYCKVSFRTCIYSTTGRSSCIGFRLAL